MANDVSEQILQVFAEVFRNKGLPVPVMTSETALDGSLGLESLDFAVVVVRLEEIFGIDPFADGVPADVRTVADLARLYQ